MKTSIVLTALMAGLLLGCESLGIPDPFDDGSANARTEAENPEAGAPIVHSDLWDGQKFGDVPIPRQFHIVFDKSFTHSSPGGVRIADVKYVGGTPPDEVVKFFQEEMPEYGWEFELLCGVESKMLTYVKGKEQLQVMVSQTDPGLTMVGVQLFPK